MNASKEEARKANKDIEKAAQMLDVPPGTIDHRSYATAIKRCLLRVQNFVEAAERKLPTEAAFDRDSKRRSKKDIVKALHT